MDKIDTSRSSSTPATSPTRERSRLLDVEIGGAIRRHRKRAKMTLTAVAQRLGIAYQQVQKYETGANRIGAGRLVEIADVLGIHVSEIFPPAPGTSPAEQSSADADRANMAEGDAVLQDYFRIKNPEQRMMVRSYIRSIAEQDKQ